MGRGFLLTRPALLPVFFRGRVENRRGICYYDTERGNNQMKPAKSIVFYTKKRGKSELIFPNI